MILLVVGSELSVLLDKEGVKWLCYGGWETSRGADKIQTPRTHAQCEPDLVQNHLGHGKAHLWV